jgi:hypothetical protein
MEFCQGCFTTECQCDPCIIFATWLNMDDNRANVLTKRPIKPEDLEWAKNRKWIDRQIWLLNDARTAIEEGCPAHDPFIAGQWADRERIGTLLVSKLCKDGKNCFDDQCKFIIEILKEIG